MSLAKIVQDRTQTQKSVVMSSVERVSKLRSVVRTLQYVSGRELTVILHTGDRGASHRGGKMGRALGGKESRTQVKGLSRFARAGQIN